MKLIYGTAEEHTATIERTKAANPYGLSVWTGDIRRNQYLQENLAFLEEQGLGTVTLDTSDEQQSNFVIKWTT